MGLFEEATRKKLRFDFKGVQTVESLWDLSVEDLDTIYGKLMAESSQRSVASLLVNKTNEGSELQLKIDIVKHIVSVKLQEAEEAKMAAVKKEEKQKLLAILAKKQDEELEGKSAEELQAMIDAL